MKNFLIDEIINNALKEDIGFGDITSNICIDEEKEIEGYFLVKADGIISGIEVVKEVFRKLDSGVHLEFKVNNGDVVKAGMEIGIIRGKVKSLLAGERVALNFLQHLSGIASKTAYYVSQVEDLDVKVVGTRKTTPNLRVLEKEAVRHGGGINHRFSLSDGILIKDNHIKGAGGIKRAIEIARNNAPHTLKIEVETSNIEEVKEALLCRADIIMLDNMSLDMMKESVVLIDGNAIIEASGNMSDKNIREIGSLGVDIISIGGLTNSIKSLDISMKFR